LPVPFRKNGDVDAESLRRVVSLLLSDGANGLDALGITGEVARLNERERRLVLETVIAEVNRRIPVIGNGGSDGGE
jgi:4-hydroxy-tetrahydrodipicolinate synthase